MVDPATAFQIGCGAIQLAELCYKGIKTVHEISKNASGLTDVHERIVSETKSIQDSSTSVHDGLAKLISAGSSLSADQKRLEDACKACVAASSDLTTTLDRLRVDKQDKTRARLKKLFGNFAERHKIRELQEKIEKLRKQVDTDLLIVLR